MKLGSLSSRPGHRFHGIEQGSDYVFLLDVSSSMADDGKLGVSRQSIDAFVAALAPEDRFDLITFNVQARALFGDLRPAEGEPRAAALRFLQAPEARGGTQLRPAMAAAYRYKDPDRTLNVVVLTDGMTEQQERAELTRLLTARPGDTRVFCVGVGNDVERPLLTRVAESAGGFAAFVSQGRRATTSRGKRRRYGARWHARRRATSA